MTGRGTKLDPALDDRESFLWMPKTPGRKGFSVILWRSVAGWEEHAIGRLREMFPRGDLSNR